MRADVCLVMPRSKDKLLEFELVHTSIVPSILHLAGQSLVKVIQANQRLQPQGINSKTSKAYALSKASQNQNDAPAFFSSRFYRYGLFAIVSLLVIGGGL